MPELRVGEEPSRTFGPSSLIRSEPAGAAVFAIALVQLLFFTLYTLNQPLTDMGGFRPAQTVVNIPYMFSQGAWLNYITPVFGEPWIAMFEFPLYQWCVALLSTLTSLSIDASGRIVSALFAIGVLWPMAVLAQTLALSWRFVLIASALWLLAPVVVYWGRSVLIETASAFLAAVWLAYYIRFLATREYRDFAVCLGFGVLSALVKVTALAGFLVVGAGYTGYFLWQRRHEFACAFGPALIAGSTVIVAAAALWAWSRQADFYLHQNPLASLVSFGNLQSWYFGRLKDRMGIELWTWTIRDRALAEGLGIAWLVVLIGWIRLSPRSLAFWSFLLVIAGYLSVFLLFPNLHIIHNYYQVENVILLATAAAIVIEALLREQRRIEGYGILAIVIVGQFWTLYFGYYLQHLKKDLRQDPRYQTALVLRNATPPDAVVIVFGLDWGSDLPYFANRRAIMVANWFSPERVRRVVLDERERWFGGRKLGAVVECSFIEHLTTEPPHIPTRDELLREFSSSPIEAPGCRIFVSPG